jgi:hypothetical protein
MVARVEEHRRTHRPPQPVEHVEVDLGLRVRRCASDDLVDTDGSRRARDPRFTCDAIAHRRRRIVVQVPEVALAVDERVAQRERLRHADERVVDRRVAVRVVRAHHVADDARALLVRPVGLHPRLVHAEEDAPVDGLEAVAHVGERARDDHAHRVVEEARAHLLLELAGLDATRAEGADVGLRHRGSARPWRSAR